MTKLEDLSAQLTSSILATVQEQVEALQAQMIKQVQADVAKKLAAVDVQLIIKEYVDRTLGNAIKTVDFPPGSIPGSAIDLTTFKISGDNVTKGTAEGLSTTGIQDSASSCQVTILDEATVIENRLVAAAAEVKGDLTVEGSLNLLGEMDPDSPFLKDIVEHAAGVVMMTINKDLFDSYSRIIFDRIKSEGLDLSRITLNGNDLVKGNLLGHFVTESNIQKLGELKTLFVRGDADLSGSVFARNGRLGINTPEPIAAFDFWDQEIQIVGKKLRKDTPYFGTERNQPLVLGACNKENLTLNVDGSVSIPRLTVGTVEVSSSSTIPQHDAKPGTLVINSSPVLGGPYAWISLGGARWGIAGIIS